MTVSPPRIVMIAGPNGAGKTTLAFSLLPDFFKLYDFLNPDEIARGLSPLDPPRGNRKAGEILLQRIDDYIEEGRSFAFETTASGLTHTQRLCRAKEAGFIIQLIYLFVSAPDVCLARVKHRVAQGGHAVASEDILRRYYRGAHNILHNYMPLANEVQIYNAELLPKRLLAQKEGMKPVEIFDPIVWNTFLTAGEKYGSR